MRISLCVFDNDIDQKLLCVHNLKKRMYFNIIEIPQMNSGVEWYTHKIPLLPLPLWLSVLTNLHRRFFSLFLLLLLQWWWVHLFCNVKQIRRSICPKKVWLPDDEMVNWKWNPIGSMKGRLVTHRYLQLLLVFLSLSLYYSNKSWFGQWVCLLKWMNNFFL